MPKIQPAIRIQDLGMTFYDKGSPLQALQQVNAVVSPQEFVCLLGPSGSGKSTFLRLLAGLLEPTHGKIAFAQKQQPSVGLVFQQANLMPWRDVLANITLPLELRGVPNGQAQTQADELIELVGLEEFRHYWPADLSGGMAQRVAIARALIQDPDLLLLDEPFGSLDALTRERMGAELLEIWQARRKTVVMVTHSISEALLLSDRVLVLTPRPGNIRLDLPNDLPRPRSQDLRYSRKFIALSQKLRASIQ